MGLPLTDESLLPGPGPSADGIERQGRGPARGYRWAPFEPENTAALRHGARSPRFVDPVTAELVDALLADRPALDAYPEAVWAWARAEARCLLYADHHARHGLLDSEGEVRGGARVFQAERLAAELRARLGLDPRADADLRKAQVEAVASAVDLEAIRDRGRTAIAGRRAQLGEP